MNDACRPQRIEVLKSNVGEMKVEFSHTRAHIEQIMGMRQQLLQAKSADGGQQKDEPGGTGRGDANDDSGSPGRAPREEGAAGASVVATTAIVAMVRESNHSSRASDGSTPAYDMGRRPDVPAGVGPMVNMQRGGTRDSFPAGIAAHDSGGVLSSGRQRQPLVVRPFC